MKKAAIYTRTGDLGETGLVGGQRYLKCHSLIDLYGTCDELNAFIGVLVHHVSKEETKIKVQEKADTLREVQSRLFDLGSLLACLPEEREKFGLPQLQKKSIEALEREIDFMEGETPPVKNFILPGGNAVSVQTHVCRTVCRRFERLLTARNAEEGDLPENSLVYINRLSDYFFSFGRYSNHIHGIEEIFWRGKN